MQTPAQSRPSQPRHPQPPRSPWKGKPVTQSSYVHDTGLLDPLDAAHFCAAGALLYHVDTNGRHRMVLAVEERAPQGNSPGKALQRRYNFLGGKRDYEAETPALVAAREVWEETGQQLSPTARQHIETSALPVAWISSSKYALFLVRLGEEDASLVERVSALDGKPDAVHDPNLYGVCWASLWALLDEQWCRANLHAFAGVQASAIRPAVRRLHELYRLHEQPQRQPQPQQQQLGQHAAVAVEEQQQQQQQQQQVAVVVAEEKGQLQQQQQQKHEQPQQPRKQQQQKKQLPQLSSPPQPPPQPPLNGSRPARILCLHGYAQNATFFRAKTGSLRKSCRSVAEFVYLDAPYSATARWLR